MKNRLQNVPFERNLQRYTAVEEWKRKNEQLADDLAVGLCTLTRADP